MMPLKDATGASEAVRTAGRKGSRAANHAIARPLECAAMQQGTQQTPPSGDHCVARVGPVRKALRHTADDADKRDAGFTDGWSLGWQSTTGRCLYCPQDRAGTEVQKHRTRTLADALWQLLSIK